MLPRRGGGGEKSSAAAASSSSSASSASASSSSLSEGREWTKRVLTVRPLWVITTGASAAGGGRRGGGGASATGPILCAPLELVVAATLSWILGLALNLRLGSVAVAIAAVMYFLAASLSVSLPMSNEEGKWTVRVLTVRPLWVITTGAAAAAGRRGGGGGGGGGVGDGIGVASGVTLFCADDDDDDAPFRLAVEFKLASGPGPVLAPVAAGEVAPTWTLALAFPRGAFVVDVVANGAFLAASSSFSSSSSALSESIAEVERWTLRIDLTVRPL